MLTYDQFLSHPEYLEGIYSFADHFSRDLDDFPTDRMREVSELHHKVIREVRACFTSNKEESKINLRAKGFDLSDEVIDKYFETFDEYSKFVHECDEKFSDEDKKWQQGRGRASTHSTAYEMLIESRDRRYVACSNVLDESVIDNIFDEYKESELNVVFEVIESLLALGYRGNFEGLEKLNPAVTKYIQAREKILKLEEQRDNERSEKYKLERECNSLYEQIEERENENEGLKEENKNLKMQIKDVVQKVKEYKDFVLQTVREMPIIGKMVAKRIIKKDKALPQGEVER